MKPGILYVVKVLLSYDNHVHLYMPFRQPHLINTQAEKLMKDKHSGRKDNERGNAAAGNS